MSTGMLIKQAQQHTAVLSILQQADEKVYDQRSATASQDLKNYDPFKDTGDESSTAAPPAVDIDQAHRDDTEP
jgi:hypothetical protein